MQEAFFIDRWIQEGRQQGMQREVNLVLRQLKRKFVKLDAEVETKIQSLPIEKLEKLGEDFMDFTTEKDLTNWLKKNI
jgi:hypothetical protein